MRQDIARLSVFEKVDFVKKIVDSNLGQVDPDDILTMMCHIGHWHYDTKKRPLTEQEMILYDSMIKNDLNPSTVYKWFCAANTPTDVATRLRKGLISQKQALVITKNRKQRDEIRFGIQILEDGRNIIRRL